MKGINCKNIQKFVSNRNRDVHKQTQGLARSHLAIQSILGTNSQALKGKVAFAFSAEEVIYYSSEYFIVHNLLTKQNSVISKQGCQNHCTVYIDHFQTQVGTDIIFTIQQSTSHLFVGQLQITGSITESNGTNSESEMKNINWRLSRLTSRCNYSIQHVFYHSCKHYLYLLASRARQDKTQRCLWVYDLKRESMIMTVEIKPSVAKAEINRIWVTDDPNQIYLMGKNYFRFWTISFNQKVIKQSNYRNIERCLSNKKILTLFSTHSACLKLLNIITDTHILVLKRNELISCQTPPTPSLNKTKNKDNIEVQLENSLNQIYRMKFLFDEDEGQIKQNEEYQMTPQQPQLDADQFCCASGVWSGEAGECIVVATKGGNLLTFSVAGAQIKLLNQLIARKPHRFDCITASRRGDILLISEKHYQQLYIINKYSLNSDQNEDQLKPFWGMGHVTKQNIVCIDSPAIHQRLCTLGQQSTLRLWSFKGRQRKILFQQRLQNQPNQVAMHPCGLLLAINYTHEIKLMSLLPTGLYEVVSVKTNYSSIGLQYSQCGNYLVSNEQNLLMIYNPFTLKTMGFIQAPELKSSIVSFYFSPDGSYIGFHTSDFNFYLLSLDLNNQFKFQAIQPSHCQKQLYTCFYFQTDLPRNSRSQPQTVEQSLFIGCTKNKYMVLYRQLAKELIMEFPVDDCYITSLCVADGWLFAATSKGSLRVYRWPILEEECELEIVNAQQKAVRFKHPIFDQYMFWSDGKRITQMHKLGFTNKLLIARQGGILGIIRYEKSAAERTDESGERKKLVQIVNQTFFITKNESEKRNRLIEKTEGDILKVQNQIAKEKSILDRKYRQQSLQIQKNYQEKMDIDLQQKTDYLNKLRAQINHLSQQTASKTTEVNSKSANTMAEYSAKLQYQKTRNKQIEQKTVETVAKHKQRIAKQIETHKQTIKQIKNEYRQRIVEMRKQFEAAVSQQYPNLISRPLIKSSLHRQKHRNARVSLKINTQVEGLNVLDANLVDEQINDLSNKVEQVTKSNIELKDKLDQIKLKLRAAESDDQNLQKQFQKCLEEYNSSRFSNLSLHSEVLKMRTQLIERKQIMENKQQIINMAFQERHKLQNYKELVTGVLTKLQDRNEQTHHLFISKQNQLSLIFNELSSSFIALEKLKRSQKQTEQLLQVVSRQKEQADRRIQLAVDKLKQLKRYLLFEGLTEDAEQKRIYLEQQNLLTAINFYKKRMSMEFLREKKNKMVKKSALNLVLKQNKNLIEECNQLREETIDYEHEIKNIGRKLAQANKIISIETELKDQRTQVQQQRSQLEAIRSLFSNQIASYEEKPSEEEADPL